MFGYIKFLIYAQIFTIAPQGMTITKKTATKSLNFVAVLFCFFLCFYEVLFNYYIIVCLFKSHPARKGIFTIFASEIGSECVVHEFPLTNPLHLLATDVTAEFHLFPINFGMIQIADVIGFKVKSLVILLFSSVDNVLFKHRLVECMP